MATLYQRGAFDAAATTRVAATLFFYSLGIPAYFAQHIIVRTFYALKDSRTPARIALCMVGLDIAMNLCLVHVMQERGLALATAVCASIQVTYLLWRLRGRLAELEAGTLWRGVRGTLLATAIMAAVLLILSLLCSGASHAIQLLVLVAGGAIAYLIVAFALRSEELRFTSSKAT